MSTVNDSDYCPSCKVKVMDGTCFCDWPENPDVVADKTKANLLLNSNGEKMKSEEFKDKIKSIAFNRVKGGGRG